MRRDRSAASLPQECTERTIIYSVTHMLANKNKVVRRRAIFHSMALL